MKNLIKLFLIPFTITFASGQTLHIVLPNVTDPSINTFTSAPHFCYSPAVFGRHELLIFLPGSDGLPSGCQDWMMTAQEQGFHVIGLEYPDHGINPQYDTLTGSELINTYAYEVIFGVNTSPITDVNYANCIQNRIVKCLQWLNLNYPSEHWGQYYNGDSLIYSKLTFSGHSLGGNFAACIGKFRQVDRVICVSSPRVPPGTDWGFFQTSLNNYCFFWHALDKAPGGIDQDTLLKQMGVTAPVVITDQTDPFSWGNVLETVYPCTAKKAHKIVLLDSTTPIDSAGVPYFKPVWIHLMTAPENTKLSRGKTSRQPAKLETPNQISISLETQSGHDRYMEEFNNEKYFLHFASTDISSLAFDSLDKGLDKIQNEIGGTPGDEKYSFAITKSIAAGKDGACNLYAEPAIQTDIATLEKNIITKATKWANDHGSKITGITYNPSFTKYFVVEIALPPVKSAAR